MKFMSIRVQFMEIRVKKLTSFAVIRGFLCDGHIMRMAFKDARVGDADEFGFLQIVDGAWARVAHAGT